MGSGSRCNRKARKRKGFAVKSTTTTVDKMEVHLQILHRQKKINYLLQLKMLL